MINGFLQAVKAAYGQHILLTVSIIFFSFGLGLFFGHFKARKAEYKRVKNERKDAVKRSRSVLNGQLAEQIAPFLPDFPANPTEIRFIGKPVDYIAFTGASAGAVSEVVFIEVKSGGSILSPVELSLKEAIASGRVRFEEYRVKINMQPPYTRQ